MIDRISINVTCACDGLSHAAGRINDQRPDGGSVTIWAPVTPPQWQDRAENTIRCPVCNHPAQLSTATAAAVCDLLRKLSDRAPAAIDIDGECVVVQKVTDSDERDRLIVGITLKTLCEVLGKVDRLQCGDT
ncbi:hypothetical protein [Mycobacterium marinum]|uniref:hypothetical protein n=1 Tax=Mycobacterium marinum TaxID=1781 RepID=UPI002359AC2D|nr:hypothetical protein [Mycobacterium marinum]MDC8970832.1 hypothetical protein [Mycobacterium marinum]